MTESVRDPITGKKVVRRLPQSEWIPMGGANADGVREKLRIIPQDLWEAVQKRANEVRHRRANGKTKAERIWGNRKTSEADHLLSGLLCCYKCGPSGNLYLSSGSRGGYYQCFNARHGTCDNKRHVQLRKLEAAVVSVVAELLDDDVASEVADLANAKLRKRLAEDPKSIERLRTNQRELERKVHNYLDFVGDGDSSPAIRDRLRDTEGRLAQVNADILRSQALRRDPVLVTKFKVREELNDLLSVLRTEPARARGVLRALFAERIAVHIDGKDIWIEGTLRVETDGAEVTRRFRTPV